MNTDDYLLLRRAHGGHGSAGGGGPVERASRAELLRVRGNFCNLWDSAGRIVYTPALPGAPHDVFDEWMRLQREAGSTHVFFGPPIGGAAYPGVGWDNPDFWSDLPALRRFIEKVMATPAADGKGFRPVLFVGGDTFGESHFSQWPDLARALDGLHEHLIVLVAWEPVVGGWSSAQVSRGMTRLHELMPTAVMAGHGSPTRWVSSSNPVEKDDPWQGGEAEFFRSHGGEHLALWFYQTPHGRELYEPCQCPRAAEQFGHEDRCWLNRAEDGIARLGAGYHGWRPMGVCLFETVAFEAFRGQATHADARRIASAGQAVADKWGVQLGFGNGLPLEAQ